MYIHSITFIQYIYPSPFAEASLHLLITCKLSGKNLPVVPSQESNSGLPYSKPTCYQQSHAAPLRPVPARVTSATDLGGLTWLLKPRWKTSSRDPRGLFYWYYSWSSWLWRGCSSWTHSHWLPWLPASYSVCPPGCNPTALAWHNDSPKFYLPAQLALLAVTQLLWLDTLAQMASSFLFIGPPGRDPTALARHIGSPDFQLPIYWPSWL
jgi:hypothetical protein